MENQMEFKIEKEILNESFAINKELEDLLTERISDLHKVKGGKQARHAFIYYRKLLRESRDLIRTNLK